MAEPKSLFEVRARIDAIDADLIRLLADRQSLVPAAAFKADEQAVRPPRSRWNASSRWPANALPPQAWHPRKPASPNQRPGQPQLLI